MFGLRALGAAAVAALMTAAAPSAGAADAIRIGEINSYTGPLSAFTIPYRKGWQLALDEVNAQGGVLGRELMVNSRDDAGKPGNAVKFAQELASKQRVVLLAGTFLSNIGLALTDFAHRRADDGRRQNRFACRVDLPNRGNFWSCRSPER